MIFSIYTFEKPIKVSEFTIESDKIENEYNVLHITDTQYGSIGKIHFQKIRDLSDKIIDEKEIDFIVITGDFIDTGNYEEEDLSALFNFDIPVYFVLGNHEYYHGYEKIVDIVDRNYITLRNETAGFNEINIIGIDDTETGGELTRTLINNDLINNSKFNLLLFHRPSDVNDVKNLGVDLMVTGHTHGGQIFPYSLVLKLIFEYPQGLTQIDDFYLYTSDGVGLWGPKMRIGSENEITVLNIKPVN